jgi:chromosome segregation ATPase
MDQELIAYLEQRFNSIDQRFDTIDQRLDSVDKRLDSHDQRFDAIDQRFERVEDAIRHTDIKVEALRDDIRLVAEAVDLNDKKTERRFQALSAELKQEIALVARSCSDLNRRVTALEAKAS